MRTPRIAEQRVAVLALRSGRLLVRGRHRLSGVGQCGCSGGGVAESWWDQYRAGVSMTSESES